MNTYLCYTLIGCEMGSEGCSSYENFQIITADSEVEAAKKYNPLRFKNITSEDIVKDEYGNFTYHDYFTQYYILLPQGNSVCGHVNPMKIEFPVQLHPENVGSNYISKYNLHYYSK